MRRSVPIRPSKYEPPEPEPKHVEAKPAIPSEDIRVPSAVKLWKEGEQYAWVGIVREGSVKLTLRTGSYISRFLFGECLSMFERGLIKSIESS